MDNIHPLLDSDLQIKAQQYEKEKRRLGFIESFFSFILIVLFFLYVSKPIIGHIFPEKIVLQFITYIWIFLIFQQPVSLLFSYLGSYRHEHRYNFSNQSFSQWLWDYAKGLFLSLILMPLILGILFFILQYSPQYWWLITALTMIFISLIFATLFPVVILPMFNRYTPIENEELKVKLGSILTEAGIKIKGFFEQDMSRQTKKENAFLAGLGATRRVVLSDNILKNMTIRELEPVIAHEVGHYKYRHIMKNVFLSALYQLALFFALNYVLTFIFPEFLSEHSANLHLLPMFILFSSILSTLFIQIPSHAVSRYFERQADRTALEITNDPEAFTSGMAGLANRNLSNAYPSTWIKLLHYSHPPIGERLNFAESWKHD